MKRYLILISLLFSSVCYASPAMMAGVMSQAPIVADSTPNAFTFTDETGIAISTAKTSNAITVAGIDTSSAISVTGSTGFGYSKNSAACTATSGTVVVNDTVAACVTSSASNSTATTATVTIGGVADTYTVTTSAAAGIAATGLMANGTETGATSFTTQSVTPTSNALQMLLVTGRNANASQAAPSVTGNGLTWVLVESFRFDVASSYRDAYIFRAMGASPTAGALTISFEANTQTMAAWSLTQFTGVDTTGTNGSGAIVQWSRSTSTSTDSGKAAPTLASFGSANNGTFGLVSISGAFTTDVTAGGGFAKISGAEYATSSSSVYVMAEWQVANDTTVDFSHAAVAAESMVFAAEIKAQ